MSGKERTRGKVNLKQLSGQSGHVVDGLWASSPVWVELFIKSENKQNNVSMEKFNIDILKQHSRLNKTINMTCLTLKSLYLEKFLKGSVFLFVQQSLQILQTLHPTKQDKY